MASLRAKQTAALLHMLDLGSDAESARWRAPWKILVFDEHCRDIMSPLLKVSDLRKHGITLHLLLGADREVIRDAPAIYFIQPSQENVDHFGDDCACALYESFHVNFTPAIPRLLLEKLAHSVLENAAVGQAYPAAPAVPPARMDPQITLPVRAEQRSSSVIR